MKHMKEIRIWVKSITGNVIFNVPHDFSLVIQQVSSGEWNVTWYLVTLEWLE